MVGQAPGNQERVGQLLLLLVDKVLFDRARGFQIIVQEGNGQAPRGSGGSSNLEHHKAKLNFWCLLLHEIVSPPCTMGPQPELARHG